MFPDSDARIVEFPYWNCLLGERGCIVRGHETKTGKISNAFIKDGSFNR
jgi:hypothetical protein